MEYNEQTDIGEGMVYCKKHMYWRMSGEKCEDCEKEIVAKCVEIEHG